MLRIGKPLDTIQVVFIPSGPKHHRSSSSSSHLVQVAVGDLLQRLDLVDRDEVRVEVHKLDRDLLELALGQKVALDALEGLVGVVVCLLNETKLLPSLLVEAYCCHVLLLEPLERQDQKLGVVLIVERGERDAATGGTGRMDGICKLDDKFLRNRYRYAIALCEPKYHSDTPPSAAHLYFLLSSQCTVVV